MKFYKITCSLLFVSSFLFAQTDKAFFNELKSLEGKTFYGKAIYMPDTTKANDFWGKELKFTVNKSKNSVLRLPFHVGENKSRTWVLTKSKNGIQLKHDHRHDGAHSHD
jgi:hypothetical protein